MLRYVIRRVLYAIPTLLGVLLLTFFLFFGTSTPEVIARRNLGQKNPTPQQVQQWLTDHGYGEPTEAQMQESVYGRTVLAMGLHPQTGTPKGEYVPSGAARFMQLKRSTIDLMLFNFGKSDTNGESIWKRVKEGAGPSLVIQSIIFFSALSISIVAAVLIAYFRGTYVDRFGTVLTVILMSIVYTVYIIGLQFWLGKQFQYGPVWGFQRNAGLAKFILIPVIAGIIAGIGGSIRFYRTFLLDEINQDYVRTARAKGVGEREVLLRHVLKNAMIPILTSTVAAIPGLVLGGLLLETFFGIPGLGSYLTDAIQNQDFAVVRAMVFLGTLLTLVGYVLTDVAYSLVDPRVRIE